MGFVEVLDVAPIGQRNERLLGFEIEFPVSGWRADRYELSIAGWALGSAGPPAAIQVQLAIPADDEDSRKVMLASEPPNVERPDVAARFPAVEHAQRSGFRLSATLLGVPLEAKLTVVARFDSFVMPLAVLEIRREPLASGFAPVLQPLLLTTMGRAGSTWMTCLLGAHPQVVAFEPFRYEPKVAAYWAEVLRTLSHSKSASESVQPLSGGPLWWTGSKRSEPAADLGSDRTIEEWLARDAVEQLAAFCQSRIEAFYLEVARSQAKPRASCFAERGHSWRANSIVRELYPDCRRLFLVRDFRDVLCSRLAFIEKTGMASQFRRDQYGSVEDYVRGWMQPSAKWISRLWNEERAHSHLVRYEDLVTDPEGILASVFRYVGVDSDAATVAATIASARATSQSRQDHHKTATSDDASIGRWREELTPELVAECEDVMGQALVEFGYPIKSEPPQ